MLFLKVSTEEITVLGHQLITYDHKLQMKVGVVLNIKVVYSPHHSITPAFDTYNSNTMKVRDSD